MNEQTVARVNGADGAWAGWPTAADRADAPRPEAVRSEAVGTAHTSSGPHLPAESVPEGESTSRTREAGKDAVFPTSYARFEINAKTQRLSIKIVDAATDEVIREIPSEQVQRIAEDLQSLVRQAAPGRRPAAGGNANGPTGAGVDRYV